MTDSVIWILTADDWNAQIHVTADGSSSLLHAVHNRIAERIIHSGESADFTQFLSAAGFDAPRGTHLCFAHELLALLGDGVYDGLIIMATPQMMAALQAIAAPGVRRRVIAEIAMAAPIGNPDLAPESDIAAGRRDAARADCFDFAGD